MRPLRKTILAGAAVIAVSGATDLAAAAINNAHVLDVRLPDGSLEHIRYVGDTPPAISFAAAPADLSVFSPAYDPFGPSSPFAALERMSAVMDRQASALLQQAGAQPGPAFSGPDLQVDVRKLPAGAQGFSMVSTFSGTGGCTRSIQYTSLGDGKPPQVVTRTLGDCKSQPTPPSAKGGALAGPATRASQTSAIASSGRPQLTRASYDTPSD